jgi:hypothetical protein
MARACWLAALTLALLLAAAVDASASSAPIETVAGGGADAVSTTAVSALSVNLPKPWGLAPGLGGLLVTDPALVRVLKLDSNGKISAIAGTGATPSGGDSDACPCPPGVKRSALNATFGSSLLATWSPQGVAALNGGGYLIADTFGSEVRMIDAQGYIYQWAGTRLDACGGDGIAATSSALGTPVAVHQASDGNVLIADQECQKVRLVSGGNITTIAGNGGFGGPPPDNGSGTSGNIGPPIDVSSGPSSLYYVVAQNRIWEFPSSGQIYRIAGDGTAGYSGDGASGRSAELNIPSGIVGLATSNSVLVYDAGNARIRRIAPDLTITTIAGTGTAGQSADGTPADQASLDTTPSRLALTDDGLFFTQPGQGLIREIPATAITSGPPAISNSKTADFGLASWDDTATYGCKADGQSSFTTCHQLTNLSDGQHTFYARAATTAVGTTPCCTTTVADPTPAARTWTVDATAPSPFELQSPADNAGSQPLRPALSWSAATDPDPGTGIDHYEVLIDGGHAADVAAAACAGSCSFQPASALSEATHTWQVKAFDKAGNTTPSATRTFSSASPPVASYVIGPTHTLTGKTVNFDASGSSDDGSGIADYAWDLDGDGTYETDTSTTPTTSRVYTAAGVITTHLRVTDGIGLTSTASGDVTITAATTSSGPLGVSINDGAQFTNDPRVTVFAVWPSFDTAMLISNDGGFRLAKTFPVAAKTPWTLDSSGPERLPKTIYVRFTNGAIQSETFQDDIILDQTPPQVVTANLAPAAGATSVRAAVAKKLATLKIKATDNVSGVGTMQVTTSKRRPGKLLRYKRSVRVTPAKLLFVRVRDRAGNFSRWRKAVARR